MDRLSRKLGVVSFSVVAASLLLGCPGLLKKKGVDAGDDETADLASIADAATVTVTGSGAKNERDVLRYAKEEKVADEPATVAKDGTKVRTFPGNGAEVATLATGTAVTKVAKYFSSGVLIVWDDPAGGRLMGWVPPSALGAVGAVATATTTTAPPATTAVVRPVDAGAQPVDAGVRAVDAGAVRDAGSAHAVVDAGAATGPKPTQITYPPEGGKCPAQFVLSGPMCKRRCMIDAECPRGTFCVKDPNPTQILKVCSTDKPK